MRNVTIEMILLWKRKLDDIRLHLAYCGEKK